MLLRISVENYYLLQKEEYPWEEGKPQPSTPEEVFADEDRKRETVKGTWISKHNLTSEACILLTPFIH